MELRSRPKENSDRNKHKVKVIWRSFFGFRRRKGKLNVGLGRKVFLCCSSTVFILISETHVCHVCPPKWWSPSSTTLVSTAESVHCHGRKGMEAVGPQWEACGKGRCLLTSLRFMLLLVTRPEENSSPEREFWQYEVKERHWTFDSCYKSRWDRTERALLAQTELPSTQSGSQTQTRRLHPCLLFGIQPVLCAWKKGAQCNLCLYVPRNLLNHGQALSRTEQAGTGQNCARELTDNDTSVLKNCAVAQGFYLLWK